LNFLKFLEVKRCGKNR